MLDQANMIGRTATTMRRGTTLNTLPHPSEIDFGDRPPWAPISTAAVVAALRVDRGLFATWVCRGGLVPAPMPLDWFRPTVGRPRSYRLDAIVGWLAGRHDEHTDAVTLWRDWLAAHIGLAADVSDDAVRGWARCLAERTGPAVAGFTSTGFHLYLDTINWRDVP